MRYNGKKAFVCTSNAYAHSTAESDGAECDGGLSRTLLEKNLLKEFSMRDTRTVNIMTHHIIVAMSAPKNK